MVRGPKSNNTNTIISYHPPHIHRTTTAETLKTRLHSAGQSVYWNKIFASTINSDPTFVLLSILWYALYAWDESFDTLYVHICSLVRLRRFGRYVGGLIVISQEARVMSTNDMHLTQQLHIVRAHLLHYASLLDDFRKSIIFVLETPNPVLDELSAEERDHVRELMRRECSHLLNEISRLEQNRSMQDKRLKNVMNLVCPFSQNRASFSLKTQYTTGIQYCQPRGQPTDAANDGGCRAR